MIDGEVKVKEDALCRRTGVVKADVRLGQTDLKAGRSAAEADTWGYRQAIVHGRRCIWSTLLVSRFVGLSLKIWVEVPRRMDGRYEAAS